MIVPYDPEPLVFVSGVWIYDHMVLEKIYRYGMPKRLVLGLTSSFRRRKLVAGLGTTTRTLKAAVTSAVFLKVPARIRVRSIYEGSWRGSETSSILMYPQGEFEIGGGWAMSLPTPAAAGTGTIDLPIASLGVDCRIISTTREYLAHCDGL